MTHTEAQEIATLEQELANIDKRRHAVIEALWDARVPAKDESKQPDPTPNPWGTVADSNAETAKKLGEAIRKATQQLASAANKEREKELIKELTKPGTVTINFPLDDELGEHYEEFAERASRALCAVEDEMLEELEATEQQVKDDLEQLEARTDSVFDIVESVINTLEDLEVPASKMGMVGDPMLKFGEINFEESTNNPAIRKEFEYLIQANDVLPVLRVGFKGDTHEQSMQNKEFMSIAFKALFKHNKF